MCDYCLITEADMRLRTRYARTSKAILVTAQIKCAVLHVLVLVHPEWIGNDQGGYFGLYNYCTTPENGIESRYNGCHWDVLKIRSLSNPFRVSFFLIVAATILNSLALLSIMLLVLLRDRYVFLISSWMHLFSFISLFSGLIIYPAGWDHARVREICDSERYKLGVCRLKWAYIMAFVLVVDQLVLAIMGFVLASKKPANIPEIQFKFGTLSRFFPQMYGSQHVVPPPMRGLPEVYSVAPRQYVQHKPQLSRHTSFHRPQYFQQ
uniref:G_PROTEIN_RECEP_F1_2 domain-containing protein n=1 Tax=Panagrellus redivivus TaxID=6233 RepID=A0A7E4W477_PANRE